MPTTRGLAQRGEVPTAAAVRPPCGPKPAPTRGGPTPSLGLYWRTLRHLRCSQIVYLAARRLLRPLSYYFRNPQSTLSNRQREPGVWLRRKAALDISARWQGPVAPLCDDGLGATTLIGLKKLPQPLPFPEWQPALARQMIESGELRFLNLSFPSRGRIPWDGSPRRQLPRLWIYHLNYCDFLNVGFDPPVDPAGTGLRAAAGIALDWCEQNSTATEPGWEPYPLSVRAVNWLKFLGRNARRMEALGEAAALARLLASLRAQVLALERRLEKDLLGNHLLKNIKALIFAGALLEAPESRRWWAKGQKLLRREIGEQILPDGGHFERSPMYHALALEDLLDIASLSMCVPACGEASAASDLPRPTFDNPLSPLGERVARVASRVRGSANSMIVRNYMGHDTKPATEDANCTGLVAETVGRMASYLRWILHPDGEIPLFNDSAFGVARPSSELLARAEQVAQSFSNWSVDRAALAKGENTALSPSPKGEGFSINLCPRPRGEGGDRARRESRVRGFSGQQAAKARFSYTFPGAPCGTTATTHALADTGYAVIRETESESCLVFDAGPLGPDHQPGHGHCDILSYELSLHGQRVVVDTGVSTYEPGPDRHYERSTAAHNTLRVDGEEQAEIWGEFRVGWRPHVGRVSVGEVEGISFARGEYTGRSGLVHSRAVLHVPGRDVATWVIVDCLRGRGLHRAESFVHLHPAVRLEACEPRGHRDESAGARRLACDAETMCRQALLSFGGHRYLLMSLGAAELAVSQSWYSPEFGVRMPCHALSSVWEGRLPTTMVHAFVPAGGPPPVVGLTPEGKAIEMNGRIVPLE